MTFVVVVIVAENEMQQNDKANTVYDPRGTHTHTHTRWYAAAPVKSEEGLKVNEAERRIALWSSLRSVICLLD